MKKFAVLVNGIVDNLIIAETKEDAEFATGSNCIEYLEEDRVAIGWTHDGEKFNAPKIIQEITETIEN